MQYNTSMCSPNNVYQILSTEIDFYVLQSFVVIQ